MTLDTITVDELKKIISYQRTILTHQLTTPDMSMHLQLTTPGGIIYDNIREHVSNVNGWEDISLPLALTYENAFEHGKGPVHTTIMKGEKGVLIRIEDQGKGFDYQTTMEEFKAYQQVCHEQGHHTSIKAAQETYAHNGGAGIEVLAQTKATCCYEGKGNVINILINK